MTVKAILFDYGNTLITTRLDWNQVLRENIGNFISAIKLALPTIDPIQLAQDFLFLRAIGKQRAEHEWVETTADDSLTKALSLQGVTSIEPQLVQKGVDAFFAPEERCYSVFDGVHEMLTKLKSAGLMLAVASNATCSRLIRRSLSNAGLTPYFDYIVVSADLGICKPDPAIFTHVIDALKVQPTSVIMVGDRLDTDIAGANSVGIRSVLVDFFGDAPIVLPDGPKPDAIVRHPAELVELALAWKQADES